LAQRVARDVDCQPRAHVLHTPTAGLVGRRSDDPAAEADDQPVLFGHRDEDIEAV
jgi:hypothetical protein